MGLFGGKSSGGSTPAEAVRVPRHSSGWARLKEHLKTTPELRVLDLGPTSAGNINFITQLGHSIYMANFAEDAARPEYRGAGKEGETTYEVDRFLSEHLDFAGRTFDVVALWDTLDYLPAELLQPVIDRLFEVIAPGGQLLAFFHSKPTGDDTVFSRFHLTESDQVQMQRTGAVPLLHTYSNRQVEQVFQQYAGYKFFLAKDALREVIVTR